MTKELEEPFINLAEVKGEILGEELNNTNEQVEVLGDPTKQVEQFDKWINEKTK